MDLDERIVKALYAAVDEVNEARPADARIPHRLDQPLMGADGILDSLAVVNLSVAAEEHLARVLGVDVSLAASIGTTPGSSPFRTLRALAEHVARAVAARAES